MNRILNKHTILGLLLGLTVSAFGSDVKEWATSAASNNSSPPNGFPEGMAPSTLNDAAREVMAAVARFFTDINGELTSGGSSNAYTLTSGSVISAYADGDIFRFAANHTNTGAATLNVDGVGAQSIKVRDGGDPAAGDILSGAIYTMTYDGTNFQLLDADGIYGLARTDGNVLIGDGTAWTVESGSTLRSSIGVGIGSDVQAYDADLAALASMSKTDGNIAVANGTTFVAESGSTARASLGLTLGTDVQAYDADLLAIGALAKTDGNVIVGNGSAWVAESGATARTSLGVGTIATRALTIQSGGSPSGGSDGDVFFIY